MGVPPPRSSERRSGVGPKLASLDHLDKPGGELSVLAAEHIPEVMELAPPPLDLIDHIAHSERAHKYCEVIRPPFRHASSPALGQPLISRGSWCKMISIAPRNPSRRSCARITASRSAAWRFAFRKRENACNARSACSSVRSRPR